MRLFLFTVFLMKVFWLHSQTVDEYLVSQCLEVGVPVGVVRAILLQENPLMNPRALHWNSNGSIDMGLFQLNDVYLYSDFVPRFWHFDVPFLWDNPFHSIYIAVRHIKWLYQKFPQRVPPQSAAFSVALAYNCGFTRVQSGMVPRSSADYAVRVVEAVWGNNH
jgi:hypothetical protein